MNRNEIEKTIGLELPIEFETYDETTQLDIVNYLKQLDAIERKAYTIGKHHLGSSFDVIRSNGFAEWKKKH